MTISKSLMIKYLQRRHIDYTFPPTPCPNVNHTASALFLFFFFSSSGSLTINGEFLRYMFTCVNILLIFWARFFLSSDAGLRSSYQFVSMASSRNFIKAYHFLCLAIEPLHYMEAKFQRNREFPTSISLIDGFCRDECLLACNKVIVAGVILGEY